MLKIKDNGKLPKNAIKIYKIGSDKAISVKSMINILQKAKDETTPLLKYRAKQYGKEMNGKRTEYFVLKEDMTVLEFFVDQVCDSLGNIGNNE